MNHLTDHLLNKLFSIIYDVDIIYIRDNIYVLYIKYFITAGISTLGSVGGLTLYAYQTKYDFTTMGGALVCLLMG